MRFMLSLARRRLFLCAAVIAAPATAQSVPDQAATTEAEAPESDGDIVVTGIRASLDSAISVKRNADSVVDAISAEDIGRYPDINVAESIQRVSGVQITRARGEGQGVNIRGLPAIFTLATLSGRSVANALSNADAASTRAFDFTILAPEFVRTLEVFKAPTADLEEGGLSGTVNVRTLRALEIGRRILAGSLQGEHEGNSGRTSPRASLLFSDVFAGDRLGVTFGLSYSKRQPETHALALNYTATTEGTGIASGTGAADLNGNGVIEPALAVRIPGALFYHLFQEERERYAGLASVEYKATDDLTLYAEGLYSRLSVEAVRNENLAFLSNSSGVVSSGTAAPVLEGYPTLTDLELTRLDQRGNGRFEDRVGDIRTVSAGARWESDGWKASAEGTWSRSEQVRNHLTIAAVAIGPGRYQASTTDVLPSIDHLGTFATGWLDPTSYRVNSINGEFRRRSSDDLRAGRIDASREFSDAGLVRLAAGARYADRRQYQDNGRITVLPAGVSALYGGLPAGAVAGSVSAAPLMRLVSAGSGTYLDSYDGTAVFPTSFLASDTAGLIRRVGYDAIAAAGTYTNDATGIVDVEERTLASYVRGDLRFGRLDGNVGLRLVRTWQVSTGVSPDLSQITLLPDAGGITRVPAAAPTTVRRSYLDWLPSLNLRFAATDDVQLRLGLSRTMARPNLVDISPTTVANGIFRTITTRNPALDPFRANNLDLTAEWYFARGGLLSISGFYKKLESLVSTQVSTESYPVRVERSDGTSSTNTIAFTVSRLVNGADVSVRGFELNYQQAFTFLPAPLDGFGVNANYTFIDNSDPTKLTAASRNNYNLTGYYEKGPLSARLSYAWRGRYLVTPSEVLALGTVAEPFGTLDGSVSVRLNRAILLSVEGVNLLDRAQVVRFTTGLPASYVDSGRRLLFGVRWSL